jgi:hypothetical protein
LGFTFYSLRVDLFGFNVELYHIMKKGLIDILSDSEVESQKFIESLSVQEIDTYTLRKAFATGYLYAKLQDIPELKSLYD